MLKGPRRSVEESPSLLRVCSSTAVALVLQFNRNL